MRSVGGEGRSGPAALYRPRAAAQNELLQTQTHLPANPKPSAHEGHEGGEQLSRNGAKGRTILRVLGVRLLPVMLKMLCSCRHCGLHSPSAAAKRLNHHRMAWVEKDRNDHRVSTLLLCAGSPTTRPEQNFSQYKGTLRAMQGRARLPASCVCQA